MEAIDVARKFVEATTTGKTAHLAELISDDFRLWDQGSLALEGRVPAVERLQRLHDGFDLRYECLHEVADGAYLVQHWRSFGLHRGGFAGVEATGRRVEVRGMTMACCRGGEVNEAWVWWNPFDLLHQLQMSSPSTEGLDPVS